jgi:hypothetical protein
MDNGGSNKPRGLATSRALATPRCIKTPLPIEPEREYRKAKVHAAEFAVDNGITDYRMLYRSFRERFKLPSAYLQL